MMDPLEGKPEIAYPIEWSYTIIGRDEAAIRAAVCEVLGTTEHSLRFSHASRKGTYSSFELLVEVTSDAQRLDLYTRLAAHDAVRMVL